RPARRLAVVIGETFSNYRLTELIGEGGMGVVYLAEHPAIGRRAAVKILRPGLTDNAELTKRFFNEARAANAIRHPGIVEVFDCGTIPSGVSDIYSLGVILFEMLCGRPPFVSEGFGEMVHLHISQAPTPPREIEPTVPEDLEVLILWCLEKEPDDRVQTMADVHAALTGRHTQ